MQQTTNLSIRRRLLISLISTIFILWLISAYFVFLAAHHEVEEIYDATLAQESRILATLMVHEVEEDNEAREDLQNLVKELGDDFINSSASFKLFIDEFMADESEKDYLTLVPREPATGHRYEAKLAFLIKGVNGRTYLRSNLPTSFNTFTEGYKNEIVDGKLWRMYGLKEPSGQFHVQIGELISVRQETVSEIVFNSLWPIIVSLPFIGLFIWIVVGGGLKPLQSIADKVKNRDPKSLESISTLGVPREVVPMVTSLNSLFRRVQRVLDNERRFTADAAHELRTPIAALKTLAQAKSLADEKNGHGNFLNQVIRGVDRATHLLEQLLTLARMDSRSLEHSHVDEVDLHGESINILASLGATALAKDIELAYEGAEHPVMVPGYSPGIQILLRNLIDNAIRYTPEKGEVSVILNEHESDIKLVVIDTGPGIPEEKQQGLYQRFRRGEGANSQGSGLGLSIVKRIVDLHHATIEMANRSDRSGLTVTVSFPRAHA
ncbi:MAG: ATP-binding protein [Candidatus Thiodiazotropha endolucinida]